MSRAPDPDGIAVTGLGTVNALGGDVATFWGRLLAGDCGIRAAAYGPDGGVRLPAAVAPDPPEEGFRSAGRSRTDRFALMAAAEAVRQGGLLDRADLGRVGIVIGTTTGGIREAEEGYLRRGRSEAVPRSALLAFEKANTADCIASWFGFSGPRYTLHSACASGGSAIAMGAKILLAELADAVVVGGSDALARLVVSGFHSLRLVDGAACRPFDRNRRGLSLGEGAGVLVLETEKAARRRGARIVARLLGTGQTTDAHHLTAPGPGGVGAARALRAALDQAGLSPESVDHVNAHGTGTQANDAAEVAAIRSALGARAPSCPVASIKGSIGHTLGAAGAIEAIAAIQTLVTGLAPPSTGLREPDPDFDLDFVLDRPRAGDWRVILSNSFGFGGANTVLCLGTGDA